MKQLFSHIGEKAEQIYHLWKKGNKQGQPYNCTSLLPGGSFQAAVQKQGTQTDHRSLAELKGRYWLRQVEFSRQMTRKEGAPEKERALEICRETPSSIWLSSTVCCVKENYPRPGKDPLKKRRHNNSQRSHRAGNGLCCTSLGGKVFNTWGIMKNYQKCATLVGGLNYFLTEGSSGLALTKLKGKSWKDPTDSK